MAKVNIKLKSKKEVASDTMTFHFSKPAGLTFKAGQFADYTLIKPSETDAEEIPGVFPWAHLVKKISYLPRECVIQPSNAT